MYSHHQDSTLWLHNLFVLNRVFQRDIIVQKYKTPLRVSTEKKERLFIAEN